MRPHLPFQARALVALCALSCFAAVTAGPLAPGAAGAGPALTVELSESAVGYGESVVATGRLRPAATGRTIALEQRSGAAWTVLGSDLTDARGRYRIAAQARRSGALRARLLPQAVAAATEAALPTAVADVASRVRGLSVVAVVRIDRTRATVRVGQRISVRGHARPALAGRLVLLQRRQHGRWHTIAHTRTHRHGRFTLRLRVRESFSAALRVRTVATSTLGTGVRAAGRAEILRPSLASWYGAGHFLACGGVISGGTMGVAHKTLPCGTLVTIRYRGRQIRVPVVDRGPFIAGREFDLAPGARNALGFDGVGTIWVAN